MLTLEDKLEELRIMKQDLTQLKADEMALRIDVAEMLGAHELEFGSHDFDYPGLKVKMGITKNVKIDKNILETLTLSDEEAECIRWKPELDAKIYKNADDTETLEEAIIITTGAPTITVELVE